MVTLQLLNKVLPTMEEKIYSICEFLNYKACFDALRRLILFRKVERFDTRGVALELIKSYFSNRKQYVNCHILGRSFVTKYLKTQNLRVLQGSK